MTSTAALNMPAPGSVTKTLTSVLLGNLRSLIAPEVDVSADELTPVQVAREFGVSPATVRRWEKAKILVPTRRLPGSGYRRYSRAAVDALHRQMEAEAAPIEPGKDGP